MSDSYLNWFLICSVAGDVFENGEYGHVDWIWCGYGHGAGNDYGIGYHNGEGFGFGYGDWRGFGKGVENPK
jgi:hypothetical protein